MSYEVSAKIQGALDQLLAQESVKSALAFAEQDADQTLENQIELCKIEAPTFHEENKSCPLCPVLQRPRAGRCAHR